MKKLILGLILCFTLTNVCADEGMWLPSLIGSRINDMRQKGFKLSADDIYSINKASMKDAVVLFGGGCTGEYVSDQGLLLTNHHCGYSAIQKLSAVAHDYLTDGFWAKSQSEELPCEGLSVRRLVRMEDVTARIAAGEDAEAIIAEVEGGYFASVEQMYYGNQYFLFVYEVFTDVRLVAAPPSSIGKFGGDTDNWIWPRHTGDFSIFRVYAGKDNKPAKYSKENQPYRPARHFAVSTKGVKEGDFTMIYGYPANTQEYVISDAVEYVAEVSNPMKIALRTERLNIISAAQEKDPAIRIQYAAKHASIANAWKKWQGEALGIQRLGTIEKKRAYEKAFTEWAADKPEYAHLLDSMHVAYNDVRNWYYMGELYAETGKTIELCGIASVIYAAKHLRHENIHDNFRKLYVSYNVDVDRALAKAVLNGFEHYCPAGKFPVALREEINKYGGTIDAYVDYVFDNSNATSFEKAEDATKEQLEADPARRLFEIFQFDKKMYRNMSNAPEIERWYRTYMKALREWDKERAFYPDANFTLRVAYGSIAGYEYADGEYHNPVSTLDGIIEKDNPNIYDYNIPQVLRDIYAAKDYGRWGEKINGRYTVPVAFIATNHTSGGNSGSPVINGKGELIGINFDRTWRSTMSDIEFDPTICRNIAVDIRYVLFVIDRVGGAGYLLEEMDLK